MSDIDVNVRERRPEALRRGYGLRGAQSACGASEVVTEMSGTAGFSLGAKPPAAASAVSGTVIEARPGWRATLIDHNGRPSLNLDQKHPFTVTLDKMDATPVCHTLSIDEPANLPRLDILINNAAGNPKVENGGAFGGAASGYMTGSHLVIDGGRTAW